MTQYAKFIDTTHVEFPTASEFKGIPNWQKHNAKLREHGYMPLMGEPEPRLGYTATPSTFSIVPQSETRLVPMEVKVDDFDPETGEKTGEHREWRDTEVVFDTSYIQITSWTYTPIEPPEPAPLPTRFSKGTLLEALQGCNLYNEAREIYANDLDLQIAWAGFNDIDLEYTATKAIMGKYPVFFNEANVNALLNWIKENA